MERFASLQMLMPKICLPSYDAYWVDEFCFEKITGIISLKQYCIQNDHENDQSIDEQMINATTWHPINTCKRHKWDFKIDFVNQIFWNQVTFSCAETQKTLDRRLAGLRM